MLTSCWKEQGVIQKIWCKTFPLDGKKKHSIIALLKSALVVSYCHIQIISMRSLIHNEVSKSQVSVLDYSLLTPNMAI